ncbi:unnamed protein product, partial [Heterotrigona itama]
KKNRDSMIVQCSSGKLQAHVPGMYVRKFLWHANNFTTTKDNIILCAQFNLLQCVKS